MRTSYSGPITSVLTAAALSLLSAVSAAGQQATSVLRVVVTDASTGEPLGDARLRLRDTRIRGDADAGGRIVLGNLAPGGAVVEVSRLGYTPVSLPVVLAPGEAHDLAVELRVDPVALEALNAEARTPDSWGREMLDARGFFERRTSGPGVFMDRAEIKRANPRSMAQLLSRHRRLNVSYDAWSTAPRGRRTQAGDSSIGCQPAYFVDGLLLERFDVNSIRPENVEGLEIYRGASELPPEFNRGTSGCGAVVIWTRVN